MAEAQESALPTVKLLKRAGQSFEHGCSCSSLWTNSIFIFPFFWRRKHAVGPWDYSCD